LAWKIPSGQLPVSLGMVMNNVGTLAAIGRLLPAGQGLTERVITIAGPGVARPGDYRVPLGTPISFVLEWAGAPMNGATSACQLVLGGPMMGQSVAALDTPITKGVSGVLLFQRQDMADRDGRRHLPLHQVRRVCRELPHGAEPFDAGAPGGQTRIRGNGRALPPGRLLRVRLLHLHLPVQHTAGAAVPRRQAGAARAGGVGTCHTGGEQTMNRLQA
jgi:hypothetical protein